MEQTHEEREMTSKFTLTGGTPKTLDEAIVNGLTAGPLSEIRDSVRAHIQDFLANRFAAAYLRADEAGVSSEAESERLRLLWDEITAPYHEERNEEET